MPGTTFGSVNTVLIPSLSVSNTLIDAGQPIAFTATVSGGTAPYTYNYIVINSATGAQIANGLFTGVGSATNTFMWTVPASAAGNTMLANVIVTDASGKSESTVETPNVMVADTIPGLATEAPGQMILNPLGTTLYTDYAYGPAIVSSVNVVTGAVSTSTLNPYGGDVGPIIFNPSGTFVYALQSSQNYLFVVNALSNTRSNTIPICSGSSSSSMLENNNTGSLYLLCDSNTIQTVSESANAVTGNIVLSNTVISGFGSQISLNPSGSLLYATIYKTSGTGNQISVINANTGAAINTIPVSNAITSAIFGPSGATAYVINNNNTISVVNAITNTVVNTISGVGTTSITLLGYAISPLGHSLYIYTYDGGNTGDIYIVNTTSDTAVEQYTNLNFDPGVPQFSPNNRYVYGTGGPVIDTTTGNIVAYLPLTDIAQLTFNKSGSTIYVPQDQGYGTTAVVNVISDIPYVVVHAALSAPTISESNTVVDTGQYIRFMAYEANGTPPYTYNFLIYNSVTNVLVANMLTTSNSFLWHVENNVGNTLVANVIVTDSASTPETANSVQTPTIEVDFPTLTESSLPIAYTGRKEEFTANISTTAGSAPYTYNYMILNSVTGAEIANMLFTTSQTTNTFSWVVPAAAAGDTALATVAVTYASGVTARSAYSPNAELVNTIVEGGNQGVGFDPAGNIAYISNWCGPEIIVLDTATNAVVNSIYTPSGCITSIPVFNPSGTFAYADEYYNANVEVINVAANAVVNTISTGLYPQTYSIAINSNGTMLYVANSGSNTVSVINTAANTVVNTIAVGIDPVAITFNPSNTLLYVSDTSNVVIVNPAANAVVNTIPIPGSNLQNIVFSPSGTIAYVSDLNGGGRIHAIDTATNTVVNTINTNGGFIAINPSGTFLYISVYGGNIAIISTATSSVVDTFTPQPQAQTTPVEFNPQGTLLYQSDWNTGDLGVISPTPYMIIDPSLSVPTLTASNSLLDYNQSVTITASISGGAAPYTYNFLVFNSITGKVLSAYLATDSFSTTVNTPPIQLPSSFAGNTLAYNVIVTDSASETTNTVPQYLGFNSPPVAGAITPNAPGLDLGQSITLDANPSEGTQGATNAYDYQWYTSSGGSAPACTSSNAISGATSSTYAVSPSATSTYAYLVTDFATTPVSACSSGDQIEVNAALAPANIPSTTANSMDSGQGATITDNVPYTGTPPYSWKWLYSLNGGTYAPATPGMCAVPSGSGAVAGDTQTCAFTAPSQGGTYSMAFSVTDNAYAPETTNSAPVNIVVTSTPGSGGSGLGPSLSVVLGDNIGTNAVSSAPIFHAYLVGTATHAAAAYLYYQEQLPVTVTVPQSDYLNFSFACTFGIGTTNFSYSYDVYGLGSGYQCGRNYTVYGSGSYDVIYTPTAQRQQANTTTPATNETNATAPPANSIRKVSTTNSSVNTTNATAPILLSPNLVIPLFGLNLTLYVDLGNGNFAKAVVTNTTATSPPPPKNTIKVESFSVYSAAKFQSFNVILSYECSYPSGSIAPYYYLNGTWNRITNYTVDSKTCTISFTSFPASEFAVLSASNMTGSKRAGQNASMSNNAVAYLTAGVIIGLAIALILIYARRLRNKLHTRH